MEQSPQVHQPRYADASWTMEVDCSCPECKQRIIESIVSIVGVYDIDFNGTQGIVKISGEVDPNMLIRTVRRCDRHAKILGVRITHPEYVNRNNNIRRRANCNDHNHNHNQYPAVEYGQCNGSALALEGGGCGSGYGYNSNYHPSIYPAVSDRLAAELHGRPYGGSGGFYRQSYPQMDYYYDRMRAEESWCTIM
ncbi:OLC1v1020589C1 [Oldenlandia corymbosa var. corymbosa]|uniref:OLC1v1020589C1 n=1 Tax=Oldenlandia corymbosa var. corymbosa TaxID=529605 RepID=A0AAV1EGT4_OLDCO|nr:OLC1v1020589C1 [Oldenlandia corymbosa var. corymbosa]